MNYFFLIWTIKCVIWIIFMFMVKYCLIMYILWWLLDLNVFMKYKNLKLHILVQMSTLLFELYNEKDVIISIVLMNNIQTINSSKGSLVQMRIHLRLKINVLNLQFKFCFLLGEGKKITLRSISTNPKIYFCIRPRL